MSNLLPALQIFLPLLAAPLAVIISRWGKLAWMVTMVTTWAVALLCAITFGQVLLAGEPLSYHMGGWAPPMGIELHIDLLSGSMMALVSLVSAILAPYCFRSVNDEISRERQPYFYAAFLLYLCGLLGILATHDAFNLYVFIEISSLSSYILIALGRDQRSYAAAFQYLVLGTIGATFILIGIGFLYLMTGTLNMGDMAVRLAEIGPVRPVLAGFAFLAIGICLKVALFPLHGWLPNAYSFAPSVVSAFMGAVGTKVALYALLRFFYSVFGYDFSFSGMHLALILTALSVPAILIGSVVAIFETNLKRMLAFSSIAQVGYITLGIGIATPLGLTAGVLHMFNHALIKGALFMALGCLALRLGGAVTVDNIRGIGRKMPYTAFAFVIAGLGLVGVPFTGGFISKWHLLMATLDGGWWIITAIIAGSSVLAVIYIWRVVEALYFGRCDEAYESVKEAPASMVIPLWIMAGLILFLGLDSAQVVEVANGITSQLIPEAVEPPITGEAAP